jgi:cystathionine beta-lyase/cystathionine gamma-synthase
MAADVSLNGGDTPAGHAMMEAIELKIQGRSPYPDRACFLNAGIRTLGKRIAEATKKGYAVVLVWEDGTARVIQPEPLARPASEAPPAPVTPAA